ncbi:MAG: YihY/virulence factor BrkB family protein [Actinomycetota bacterium]|nr:YihY/virulence factor BrkB family protein [Actinomycetota bacterium]
MTTDRITTNLRVFRPLMDRLRLTDPLLMAAAIAFNWFFALVPLAIAFVGVLGAIGGSVDTVTQIEQVFADELPPEIAEFLLDIISEAAQVVGNSEGIWVTVGLVIALWSGSRGIYAIQKSLRLMEGLEETRPYWHVRGIAIAMTVISGIALAVGYVIVLFGEQLVALVERRTAVDLTGALGAGGVILAGWLVLTLYVIYRWGPPERMHGALVSGVVTTSLLAVGTWLAGLIMPRTSSSTLALLGSVGIILLWLYYTALAVIVIPAVVEVLWEHYRGHSGVEPST